VVLRKLFERLGATYIKLGQFIASSPSLFPDEYVLEFQKCLDKTQPLPYAVIKGVLEKELKQPLDEVFSYIDPQPLASASVAQVGLHHHAADGKVMLPQHAHSGQSRALASSVSAPAATPSVPQ
jgi:aarF domain-containing kinase